MGKGCPIGCPLCWMTFGVPFLLRMPDRLPSSGKGLPDWMSAMLNGVWCSFLGQDVKFNRVVP